MRIAALLVPLVIVVCAVSCTMPPEPLPEHGIMSMGTYTGLVFEPLEEDMERWQRLGWEEPFALVDVALKLPPGEYVFYDFELKYPDGSQTEHDSMYVCLSGEPSSSFPDWVRPWYPNAAVAQTLGDVSFRITYLTPPLPSPISTDYAIVYEPKDGDTVEWPVTRAALAAAEREADQFDRTMENLQAPDPALLPGCRSERTGEL